jgi:hypothetical protein
VKWLTTELKTNSPAWKDENGGKNRDAPWFAVWQRPSACVFCTRLATAPAGQDAGAQFDDPSLFGGYGILKRR